MRPLVRLVSLLVWAWLLVCASHAGAQSPADTCRIDGALTLARVRVVSVEGRAPRYVALEGATGTITPLRHGLVGVESTLSDGRRFEGTSRVLPALEIREHVSLPGLELGAGVAVLDVEPIAGTRDAEVALGLAPGVVIREMRLPCSAIAVVVGAPRTSDLAFPADLTSPRLWPRARDLHVRPEGASELDIGVRFTSPERVVLFEHARMDTRLRVVLSLGSARIEGWVEARDVIPITEALTDRPRVRRRRER